MTIEPGDRVELEYVGRFENGPVFATSDGAVAREHGLTDDPEAFEAMVGEPPTVGQHVEAQNGLHGDVTAVTEDEVQVDFNHELAGNTLVFDLSVLSVK